MTARVHDVILEVGLKKTKGERLRLTSATEIDDFLDIEDEVRNLSTKIFIIYSFVSN